MTIELPEETFQLILKYLDNFYYEFNACDIPAVDDEGNDLVRVYNELKSAMEVLK